ncbi:hypothetical protein MNBD_GAMMA22-1524 [hydrothermal vent metagenome]|uniref:Uncharacterized protein n=1 Tax=hydrothermal vent metagenome TaxID=652676 RepID=A0A3B1A0Y7_9ZZZZ
MVAFMTDSNKSSIVTTYNHLLENLHNIKNSIEVFSREDLSMKIEYTKLKLHDFENITKEELNLLSKYIHDDFTSTTEHIHNTSDKIKNWLKNDIELTEDRLLELFANVVDQSRVELQQMETQLHEWHSGEVASKGDFECKNCGKKFTFSESQTIENCPSCNGEDFQKSFEN